MEIIRQRIISNNTQRPVAYIVYIIGGGMIILPRVNYEDLWPLSCEFSQN